MSSSDTNFDPALGPWNMVQCRENTILFVPTGEQNANGVVVALDLYLNSVVGTGPRAIFTLRNSANLAISFTAQFNADREVHIWYGTSNSTTSLVRAFKADQILTNSSLFSLNLSDHTF